MEKINSEIILNEDDVLLMLDNLLEKRDSEWWDNFYSNKERQVPFFKNIPDENLVSYFDLGILKQGKALDIGCGNGRNSLYLASKGLEVYGIDFAKESIEWARKKAKEQALEVNFLCKSIFDLEDDKEGFDFIYDGGCFHHMKPHRRDQYLKRVLKLLKSDGYFAMYCFNLKGGANVSDYDVYRECSMHGGLGFSEHKLKKILEPYFNIIEFREMKQSLDENVFGMPIFWTVLMKRR